MNDDLEQAAQTASEHAAAAAAAAGGGAARARPSRPAALKPDTPAGVCANCRTDLQGPVCHVCGQVADEYHRPVRGLLREVLEGLVALDGRVARTIPDLLLRPGRVTRAYLKGARARFMPPFRLYIIASLIFFFLAPSLASLDVEGVDSDQAALDARIDRAVADGELSAGEAEDARRALARLGLAAPPESGETAAQEIGAARDSAPGSNGVDPAPRGDGEMSGGAAEWLLREWAPETVGAPAPDTWVPLALRRHVAVRFGEVAQNPGGWFEAAADWVPRIMFVMVPVYALLLSLVYVWRRSFFFYDHLLVSLHLHSALFLVMAILFPLSGLIGGGLATLVFLIYSNVYLYRLNRVVYARGRFASAARALALDGLYFFVLLTGFVAVLLLGALA